MTASPYFITFTCVDWLPLFEITHNYDSVYKWFEILKEKYQAHIVAYVIMPNHFHAVLHFQQEGFNLNSIVANGKRFIAYEIINRLETANNKTVLEKLSNMVTEREKKRGNCIKYLKIHLMQKQS